MRQSTSNPARRPALTRGLILALFLYAACSTFAATRYVDLNSASPAAPYTDWTTAATNIQDAIDAADADDEVVVTNGVYAMGGRDADGAGYTNRVVVDRAGTPCCSSASASISGD